jgi:lactate dehydrogenase-like 2-hydroxyacid dehydrogenase
MASYKAALSSADVQKRAAHRKDAGSFGYVCRAYYASVAFKSLDVSTQCWRRRALDSICERHGDKPIKLLLPIRDELSDRPGAARNRLKALRALFRWAVELDHAEKDPTRDIKPLPYVTAGHHAWSLEEVEIFEAFHPIGSKARLAMALMLYTACRREDAVRLGPQHIRHGRLQFRQAKNEHRNPVDIDIPLHPDLVEIIEASRSGHLTFLVTEYGRPFSAGGCWQRFIGDDLAGQTLGLLGLCNVGSPVAKIGKAFGMNVIGWSQNLTADRAAEVGVELVTKDELFRRADFVSVHVVLSDRTRGLVGAPELALMKPTARLVNTSRGPIVVEADIIAALNAQKIAGAAIDVFDQEPLPLDHPFRTLPNLLATPHIGYASRGLYTRFYHSPLARRPGNGLTRPVGIREAGYRARTARH